MPPSDRWPVGLVAGVARALAAFAAAVRGRSSSRRWRARSACRAVCALPRLRAAVAPVVWLAGRGGEGCFILQRPRMGNGHAPLALRSPPLAAIQPKPRACTQIFVYKKPRPEKYWQGTAGNGSRTQNRGE